MPGRKKPIPILFYVDEAEEKIIKQKIGISKLSKSEYLRRMAVDGYIIKQDLTSLRELTNEINKIGVNINQIAKHANEMGVVSHGELKEVKGKIIDIWLLLKSTLLKEQ